MLKRGRSTNTPTKAQADRLTRIKELGCLVAIQRSLGFVPAEVHHLTSGGHHGQKRRGHDFTIGLNQWSHRGVPFDGWSMARCEEVFGPSYARNPNAFREQIGSDAELLARQNQLLGETNER